VCFPLVIVSRLSLSRSVRVWTTEEHRWIALVDARTITPLHTPPHPTHTNTHPHTTANPLPFPPLIPTNDPETGLLDLAYEKEERAVVRGALPPQSQFTAMMQQEEGRNARGRKRRRVAVKREGRVEEEEEGGGSGGGGGVSKGVSEMDG
jgi:hypothetical protein